MKNNTTKVYVFMSHDIFITKLFMYPIFGVFSIYAVVANAFILYIKTKLRIKRKRNVQNRRPFDRFPVVSIFVQSLAFSDFFCGLITLPVAITTNFVDVISNDMICKAVRFCNIFFPVVTINNLFVIGIERYLAVFYPLHVPSNRAIKGFVLGAWILGGISSVAASATFSLETRDLSPTTYTKTCVYNKSVLVYKAMFIGITVVVYLIPSIILTFTCLRLACFLRRKRKTTRTCKVNSWRFYGTSTFVILIFSFVIPYLLYVSFSAVNVIFKFEFNFTVEFIIRRISAMLAYANSAISPTVMLFSMPDLRGAFRSFVRRYFRLQSTRIRCDAVENNTNPPTNGSNNLASSSETNPPGVSNPFIIQIH